MDLSIGIYELENLNLNIKIMQNVKAFKNKPTTQKTFDLKPH